MAVKTITIDMEAYTLLARRKNAGESFSQVIKAHFGRQPTAAGLRAIVRSIGMDEATLTTMDHVVAARRTSPARAVRR